MSSYLSSSFFWSKVGNNLFFVKLDVTILWLLRIHECHIVGSNVSDKRSFYSFSQLTQVVFC